MIRDATYGCPARSVSVSLQAVSNTARRRKCLRGRIESQCSDQVRSIIGSPELCGHVCVIIIVAEARGVLDESERRRIDLYDGVL